MLSLLCPAGPALSKEIFEQWRWAQLGMHAKPCGFLNVNGYFTPLIAMIERMVTEGFMAQSFSGMLVNEPDPDTLLARFRSCQPPPGKGSIQNDPSMQSSAIRITAAVVADQAGS
jgi:predicted Rossmann-fold nucleotide-binding protein